MKQEPEFDNLDERIRYYELLLERNLKNLPEYPLPPGYRFVFYRPGDRDSWIAIEQSAKEFSTCQQGLEAWGRYFGGYEDILPTLTLSAEIPQGPAGSIGWRYAGIIKAGGSPSPWSPAP